MTLDVVRRFVEHRVPVLPVAGVARHQRCPMPPATLVCFPRRRAEARLPLLWQVLDQLRQNRYPEITEYPDIRM